MQVDFDVPWANLGALGGAHVILAEISGTLPQIANFQAIDTPRPIECLNVVSGHFEGGGMIIVPKRRYHSIY